MPWAGLWPHRWCSPNSSSPDHTAESLASSSAGLHGFDEVVKSIPMSKLVEIEAAADALTPEQKQELILFLATRLRRSGVKLPTPRKFHA